MTTSSAFQAAVTRYLTFLQSEENKSPLTILSYSRSLQLTTQLMNVKTPEQITKENVQKLKQELHEYRTKQGTGLTVRTKNHHLTILRAFLRYMIQEEERDVYPPDRIRRLKDEERKIKVLSIEELQRLIAAPDTSTRIGKRDAAILEMFFSTGLRLEELRQLNRKDINFKTAEVPVRGKGRRVRVVFITDNAAHALKRYLESRVDHLVPLFIRSDRTAAQALPPGEEFRISRTTLADIIKRYASEAGIACNPSPHTLRHSFATQLLQSGADLRSIQELLGHKDVTSTQIYTHVTNPQLKKVHRTHHPSERAGTSSAA